MNKSKFILIIFCILCSSSLLRAQKLTFSYDASGNQIERRWECVNCPSARSMAAAKQMALENPFNEQNTEQKLRVFPNPISEILSVEWQLPTGKHLKSLQVYSMGGNQIFSQKYGPDERYTKIPFNRFPPGTYLLVARYSDEKVESVKLIKI